MPNTFSHCFIWWGTLCFNCGLQFLIFIHATWHLATSKPLLPACTYFTPWIRITLLVIHISHIPLSQPRTCPQHLSVIIWYSIPSGNAIWWGFFPSFILTWNKPKPILVISLLLLIPIPTEGESLPNPSPAPVEKDWVQKLKTTCQWVKHSKEQTTMIE